MATLTTVYTKTLKTRLVQGEMAWAFFVAAIVNACFWIYGKKIHKPAKK